MGRGAVVINGISYDASELLKNLRWCADMVVVNPFGERVWLKNIEDGTGITDCCSAVEPCDYHRKLTHPASREEH